MNQGQDQLKNETRLQDQDPDDRLPRCLFAIGDIHGCATALSTLIEAIDPQPDDTIVVLGDVIDWGPDSRSCVQQLIDLSKRCRLILVRGNHEEMLFSALESESELRSWLNLGGEETLKSYPYDGGNDFIDADHVRFLKAALDYYETVELIFVHASYDPNKPMAEQSNTTLQWEFVEPEKMRRHYSGKTVIAGHTPQTSGEPLDVGFLKVLDTDCSRGGWLTALEVHTGEAIQANQQAQLRRSEANSTTHPTLGSIVQREHVKPVEMRPYLAS
jgi:serine/threonine protein phosphatase 1